MRKIIDALSNIDAAIGCAVIMITMCIALAAYVAYDELTYEAPGKSQAAYAQKQEMQDTRDGTSPNILALTAIGMCGIAGCAGQRRR